MKQYKIAGIGEVLWDRLPEGNRLGGAPANVVFHASGLGGDAILISSVGNDQNGINLTARLDEKNIQHLLFKNDYPTGTVDVAIDAHGSPRYTIHENTAWDFLTFNPTIKQVAEKTDAVSFGSLACRSEISRTAILNFIQTVPDTALKILDINLRPPYFSKPLLYSLLKHATILKLNTDEFALICKMFHFRTVESIALKKLKDKFLLDFIILTKGRHGSLIYENEQHASFHLPEKVSVKDSVGAGDAFTAAFIIGFLKGMSIEDINRKAAETAAFVCTRTGATPHLPQHITALF